ncbi:MAG TPA: hypothetical protein VK563_06195 [Puia sp.]|nr:hypothetical protein [Puia sp.]
MTDEQITRLFGELGDLKKIAFNTYDHVTIVDKRLSVMEQKLGLIDSRLSLIEQRISIIEQWVPVDNRHLQPA